MTSPIYAPQEEEILLDFSGARPLSPQQWRLQGIADGLHTDSHDYRTLGEAAAPDERSHALMAEAADDLDEAGDYLGEELLQKRCRDQLAPLIDRLTIGLQRSRSALAKGKVGMGRRLLAQAIFNFLAELDRIGRPIRVAALRRRLRILLQPFRCDLSRRIRGEASGFTNPGSTVLAADRIRALVSAATAPPSYSII